jgi:hypothetical protein
MTQSFVGDATEAVFDFAKSKLEKSYSLLKNEGFSSGFTNLLIAFISIGAIAFGALSLFVLTVIFSDYIGLKWQPLFNALSGLMTILHADNLVSLIIHSFVVLHLPVVVSIIVQKAITRNLIKKYRDKESNLIKP